MKEIHIVEPLFVSSFKCIGSACHDHCCQGWKITLDKPTVNRYLKSQKIDIKNIAVNNIVTTKKSYSNWGFIKLPLSSTCGFLDEERLCKIHAELGASALSETCASYPRNQHIYKNELHKTLTISCPEAARKLLSSPDAMLFNERTEIRSKENNAQDLDQQKKLLNLMCTLLIKQSGIHIQQGLYAIATLLIFSESQQHSKEQLIDLENYFGQLISELGDGTIAKKLSELNRDDTLQWALLLRMQTYFSAKTGTRSLPTLQHYLNKLIFIQAQGAEDNNISLSIQRIDKAWNSMVLPWLSDNPHLMSNYMQYRIYNDSFPSHRGRSGLGALYLLTSEWFLIKSLISACAELVGEVKEQDIINIIYSYHAVTKHDSDSTRKFMEEIDKSKMNEDLSLVYLLKV